MTDMALFAEQQVRADLARLLFAAVEASGRARCDIARDAQIHRDALRRVLVGERSASLGEALRILAASGVAPHAHLLLFLVSGGEHAIDWLQSDLALFFEDFSGELPLMSSPMPKEAIVGEEVEKGATAPRRVTRLIRLPEVQHRVGLGRSTIYRWMAEGKFPKPIQLGGYSVAWAENDIDEWIAGIME